MMKILYLIYDHIHNPWLGGGGAVRCHEIVRRLTRNGHSITVVSGRFPGSKGYREGDLEFVFVGSDGSYIISTFSYAWCARQYLRRNVSRYDIVVEDFAPWNPIFSYTYQDRVPVVLQVHHREGLNILKRYFALGLPFYFLEGFYTGEFRNVVSVSEATADKFKLNPSRQNIAVISNGVDDYLFEVSSQRQDYILYVGRIDFYNKGIDTLLRAVPEGMQLVLAGRGRDEERLISAISRRRNVNFVGFVNKDDRTRLMSEAKFVVIPSRFEGQSIVALEAAALGTPLVVSDIKELGYVVDNGFGVSFRTGDHVDLRRKILELFNDSERLDLFSERAREYARNFTWDAVAGRFEGYLLDIYRQRQILCLARRS